MSKTLDIDLDVSLWGEALNVALAGGKPICPRCKSKNTEVVKEKNKDGIGFLLVNCNDCGKSGYSSRVVFK